MESFSFKSTIWGVTIISLLKRLSFREIIESVEFRNISINTGVSTNNHQQGCGEEKPKIEESKPSFLSFEEKEWPKTRPVQTDSGWAERRPVLKKRQRKTPLRNGVVKKLSIHSGGNKTKDKSFKSALRSSKILRHARVVKSGIHDKLKICW